MASSPLLYAWPDNSGSAELTELLHADLLVRYDLLAAANVRITVGLYCYPGDFFGAADSIYVNVRSGGTNVTVDGAIVHTKTITAADLVIKSIKYEGPIRFQFTMAKPVGIERLKIDPLGANSITNAGKVAACVIQSIVVLIEDA